MANPPRFRKIRRALTTRWLTEGEGELVGYSLDALKDAFLDRLYYGLLARFPDTAPEDALAAIGRDRRIIRGLNEAPETYAPRLKRWLDDWRTAGNPFALLARLSEYTGPGPKFRTVDARGNWFTRDVDGTNSYLLRQSNWDWDGRPIDALTGKHRWSRFWVIIYPNGLWTYDPGSWGDITRPSWGDRTAPFTWGTSASREHVQTIRTIVSQWKPIGTRCVNIIIAFDNASFDPTAAVDAPGMPDGLWEHWSRNVGGVQVRARLDTARYWDGP